MSDHRDHGGREVWRDASQTSRFRAASLTSAFAWLALRRSPAAGTDPSSFPNLVSSPSDGTRTEPGRFGDAWVEPAGVKSLFPEGLGSAQVWCNRDGLVTPKDPPSAGGVDDASEAPLDEAPRILRLTVILPMTRFEQGRPSSVRSRVVKAHTTLSAEG